MASPHRAPIYSPISDSDEPAVYPTSQAELLKFDVDPTEVEIFFSAHGVPESLTTCLIQLPIYTDKKSNYSTILLSCTKSLALDWSPSKLA